MLYRDILQVSLFGLRGTLYVQEAGDSEGVSVQAEGPYEAKVVDDSWLIIYPERQEPPIPRRSRSGIAAGSPILHRYHSDITIGGTHVGSVDAAINLQFLTDPGPRMIASDSVKEEAIVRITAPPGTKLELINCYGICEEPRGWRIMKGSGRFDTC